MAVLISESERNEVRAHFPGLDFQDGEGVTVLTGVLDVNAVFDQVSIVDSFSVRIELSKGYPNEIPIVKECGDRIKSLAVLRGITDTRDLHCYPENNRICLCIGDEERKRFTPDLGLRRFIEELVVPYFYAFRFFERNNRWPWGDYRHCLLGYFEYYLDVRGVPDKGAVSNFLGILRNAGKKAEWDVYENCLRHKGGIKGHLVCPSCKNFSKLRNCHPNALKGMRIFRQDMNQFGVQI